MPSATTQRYLAWIGVVGVLTFCFGCSRLMFNDFAAGNVFLILAWLILVPLFLYLISARRHMKRAARAKYREKEGELEALGEAFSSGTEEGKKEDR